jgi:RNA polymerase sigma-70 factor (sigma-E family)
VPSARRTADRGWAASSRDVSQREFEEFAARELPGLLRYAVMLTGEPELAQDLVQDVLVKAHSQWRRVAAADHPRLYVKTMVTRAHLSWRRRWAVRHIVLASANQLDGEPVRDHALSIVDRDDVWRRLAGLPARQRAVLVLRYYERLTDQEIAIMLGCSAGTVRGYASRALARLRLELADELSLPKEPR